MPVIAAPATMHGMPAPAAHQDLSRRVLDAIAGPPSSLRTPRVGRYRLTRVAMYTRPDPSLDRFGHLRRSYD
jgi:hypothetical protein